MMRCFLAISAMLLIQCSFGYPQTSQQVATEPLAPEAVISRVRAGIELLNQRYWSPTLAIWFDRGGDDLRGFYERRHRPTWWPSANAVELLIDFMNVSGTADYDTSIATLYDVQKDAEAKNARLVAELKRRNQWSDADEQRLQARTQKAKDRNSAGGSNKAGDLVRRPAAYYSDFQNEYLDDSGWWAVAWLKMYDRTKSPKYLNTAKAIHAHIAKNWRPDKCGGIVWCEDEDKQRPNAITNSLFIILSARLHQRTGDKQYLSWAEEALTWFQSVGLYDGIAVVDAPEHLGDYWSYNQGTYIGGLCALYEATGKQDYLTEAVKVSKSVLQRGGFVLGDGVIIEKLGTGGDATLFKGIFVRYLAQLRDLLSKRNLDPETVAELERCIRASADAILTQAVAQDGLYMAGWHDTAENHTTSFNTQLSALTALLGVIRGVDPTSR